MLLLGGAPLAVLPGGLWWLPGPPAVVKVLQRLLLVVSALVVLAGEGGWGGWGMRVRRVPGDSGSPGGEGF